MIIPHPADLERRLHHAECALLRTLDQILERLDRGMDVTLLCHVLVGQQDHLAELHAEKDEREAQQATSSTGGQLSSRSS